SYRPIEYEQGKWLIHKQYRKRVKEVCPKSLEDYHKHPNGNDVAEYKTKNDNEALLMSAKPNCIIATQQEYLHHAPYRTWDTFFKTGTIEKIPEDSAAVTKLREETGPM